MKKSALISVVALLCIAMTSCVKILPGEIGVKRKYGKLKPNVLMAGMHGINPFTIKVIKIPTRTLNREITLDLPSKEGLLVQTTISILYHVDPDSVPSIITHIGGANFEDVVILSVFKSAAPNVSSRFFAKDMHTIERANIEKQIKEQMASVLTIRGFVVEAILLKSIKLPDGLANAIMQKLEAEIEAQRMEFILAKEKQEAERKRINATGVRDAQKIISEGLTPEIIKFKSLETFIELSKSPNSKVIITDGKTPYLIGGDK
jgi:prohibitin 1